MVCYINKPKRSKIVFDHDIDNDFETLRVVKHRPRERENDQELALALSMSLNDVKYARVGKKPKRTSLLLVGSLLNELVRNRVDGLERQEKIVISELKVRKWSDLSLGLYKDGELVNHVKEEEVKNEEILLLESDKEAPAWGYCK